MEIIIVSDNHGSFEELKRIASAYPNADAYIHCGDVEGTESMIAPFLAVCGNNDPFNSFPIQRSIMVGDLKIVWLHSHTLGAFNRKHQLKQILKFESADIVCYGHTHMIDVDQEKMGLILNPGSLAYNRDGNPLSFIRVSGVKGQLDVQVISLSSLSNS